ncbi:hypothetical protein RFN58_33425 [Streptomyces iakyrus]|uniref:hypothetical protein n=1 Tax=Streptomyces iakyrus TaxID=68219 RepID=UPI000527EB81|nr:hypothetical protein [Streptomyces iakyrus]
MGADARRSGPRVPQLHGTDQGGGAGRAADGRLVLVVGGDLALATVWDLATGAPLRTFTGHRDWVPATALTADGCTPGLAVSGDAQRRPLLRHDEGHGLLASSWPGSGASGRASVTFQTTACPSAPPLAAARPSSTSD